MYEFFATSGMSPWIIVVVGAMAGLIFVERALKFHRAQIESATFIQGIYNLVENNQVAEAISICEDTPGPEARIVREALLHIEEDADMLWSCIEEVALQEVPRLERRLGLLWAMIRLVPVLGLLGTVVGMGYVLNVVGEGAPLVHSGDLAVGLKTAFMTTLVALFIAAPLYLGYEFLIGRVAMIIEDMERTAVEVYNFVNRRKKRLAGLQMERNRAR